MPVTQIDNHASYIDHWLRILRADERALMTAAARAEEASTYLLTRISRAAGTSDDDDDRSDASSGDEPVAMSFPLAA